ncbi:MAG TPA: amidohydrolase family protein, partial [Sphingomicrobium sp.]|nr:amidohydrolase family protein [Sphingomicrobium sp.]
HDGEEPMKRLLLLATALLSAAPAAAATLVTADRMLDVTTGRYVESPAILIGDDGRIQAVGTLAAMQLPAGTKHIDLAGETLLPGLIDMHTHLGPADIGGYRFLEYTDTFWPVVAVATASDMLKGGFTTIRVVGSGEWTDVGLKQAIEAGYVVGPRIVPAGHSLGATGGHCDDTYLPPRFQKKEKEEGIGDSPDELKYQVRRQRKFGAEVIKICATGGVFSRGDTPGQQQLTEAELRAVADEAHMQGLRVAAHAHGAEGIKAAIRAGIDTIEHASLVDDEGIRLAVQRKRPVWFSMDIKNTDYTQAEGLKNGELPENIRKDKEIGQVQRDNFRKAHEAGVRMVFGSDAGVMPHAMVPQQFRVMVEYGMTPLEAIQAATINASEALGRADVGRIAPGAYGDIIAVRGDPTRDVTLLEHVDAVIKGGKLVKAP